MDVEKYLQRIGCCSKVPPTLETLQLLHMNHLLSVPFEDLSFHCGEKVHKVLPRIYHKVVETRRGGFCYELNGLFSWLLEQLGYQVEILSAHVKNAQTGVYGPPFDHLVIMVTVDGHRWLCDVGFGSGFQSPLSLETAEAQKQSHGVYRVRAQNSVFYMEMQAESETVNHGGNRTWVDRFKFTLEPHQREEFEAMWEYQQNSVSSIFFCKSLCTLLLPKGRITIMGRKLITTHITSEEGPQSKTKTDLSDEEITQVLKEKFQIVLSNPLTPKDIDIIPNEMNY